MKSKILSVVICAILALLVIYVFPVEHTGWFSFHAQAQGSGPFELNCQTGSVPVSGPTGVTFNQSTQKYRATTCIDPLGNIQSTMATATGGTALTLNSTGGAGATLVVNASIGRTINIGPNTFFDSSGSLSLGGHISFSSNAPTCSVTGAGTGATCSLVQSSDNSGEMSITTGTTPAALGTITLTLNSSFGNAVWCPAILGNGNAAWNARATLIDNQNGVGLSSRTFNWDNNAVALASGTANAYDVIYFCGGR